MKDILNLRDLLSGADVPDGVISIEYCDIKRLWSIHMRESDFRDYFDDWKHEHFAGHDYELHVKTKGVKIFCLTYETPYGVRNPKSNGANRPIPQDVIDEVRAERDLLNVARGRV